MMASSWNLLCFLNQRLSRWHLTMVLAAIGFYSVTESTVPLQLRGEVGQSVTFTCPIDKQKTIQLFYLQKDKTFVNGYHAQKPLPNIWDNTKMDKTSVHMFRLKISHSGTYQCYIQYNGEQHVLKADIHLSVTANYSKPTITRVCDGRSSCQVTCASQGGYPSTKMKWNIAETGNTSSRKWEVLNSSEDTDSDTQLVNSSSTAYFNCSYGVQNFSCSVGEVTSEMFSVCVPEDSPEPNSPIMMLTAICVVGVIVIMAVSVVLWNYRKKRQIGAATGAVKPEEVIVLRDLNESKAAS